MSLLESWRITEKHLRKAGEFFDKESLTEEGISRLRSFKEFVEHNELGLAFDELEILAETAIYPEEFWHEMLLAAKQMKLSEAVERCKKHIQNI